MPELHFQIEGAEAVPFAAIPMIALKLRVTNLPATETIHSLTLRCQVQIEPAKRRYAGPEQDKLRDLFGEPERWGSTLRARLWTMVGTSLRPFTGTTTAQLTVPCSFDLNIASTKYFYALEEGEVPLLFLFSGTIFYEARDGRLQVQQISWNKECAYRMPVAVWHGLMEHHFPQLAWITLNREVFERLYAYRRQHGLTSWDKVVEELLPAAEPVEASP